MDSTMLDLLARVSYETSSPGRAPSIPWVDLPESVRGIWRSGARAPLDNLRPLLDLAASAERRSCASALQRRARDAEDAGDFVRQAIDDPASLLHDRGA